ncbi:hypothetical protein [Gordonia humi]|uniref:Uncharacterized protein n=1 Tax=Gordonia humi TaxID=686429 RepID=A0A840ERX4_9ACTN|nr:hypothetical protein [Gordonia humi]MBB4135595.1 hypothetical protein [Gordonia humi]
MEPVAVVLLAIVLIALVLVGVRMRLGASRSAASRSTEFSLIRATQRERLMRDRERGDECARIESATCDASGPRPENGHYSGFETLVVDVWDGRDFTLRHRAVGLGWLPFVGPPEHHETPEITRGRLERVYKLNDDERRAHAQVRDTDGGRIAIAAAVVAARIYRYPVWHEGVFDTVHTRVDLVDEVTYLTKAAAEIDDRLKAVRPPAGESVRDSDVVAVYVQKSGLLQARLDGLLDRLRALDELRGAVARAQVQADKTDWLDRAGTIDDVDTAADAIADSLYAIDMRDRARASEAAAGLRFAPTGTPKIEAVAQDE